MNLENLIKSLERFGGTLPAVVRDVSDEDARWKPPSGAWSILEIVCHLGDEEELDFSQRVRLTLQDSTQAWPPIDPEGWAIQRENKTSYRVTRAKKKDRLLEDRVWSVFHKMGFPVMRSASFA